MILNCKTNTERLLKLFMTCDTQMLKKLANEEKWKRKNPLSLY